ncbi:MAG TPA: hypothetical protein V6C97_24305 [Oculatellaceae cyanobacterium]
MSLSFISATALFESVVCVGGTERQTRLGDESRADDNDDEDDSDVDDVDDDDKQIADEESNPRSGQL